MVEDEVWIEAAALEVSFKVQMLGRGTTRATGQSDDLPRLNLIAHLYKVLRLMAVERLQAVGVLQDDAVAVAIIALRACHNAVEGCYNLVVGLRLEVYSRVAASASIRTYHLGARQRISPALLLHLLQIPLERRRLLKHILLHVGGRLFDVGLVPARSH